MRIVYLSTLIARNTGVPKKIFSVLKSLSGLAHDVHFIPLGPLYGWDDQFKPFLLKGGEIFLEERQPTWLIRAKKIFILARLLKKSGAEVVFYRYSPSPLVLISLIMSGLPFVTEHNTKEIDEIINRGEALTTLWKEKIFGNLIRLFAWGFITVTPEILKYQRTIAGTKKPGAVISNSIDLAEHPTYKMKLSQSNRIIFVANLEYWTGLDKAIELLEKLEDFHLYIVGDGRTMDSVRGLVRKKCLTDRIHFMGELYGMELDKFILSCDIALSTLAAYRKGLVQACPLKTRHYLALGLPIVVGYEDIDLVGDMPFVMKVPPDDTPIDVKEFEKFYHDILNVPDICLKARKYAEDHLSPQVKMSELVKFLEQARR